MTNATSARLNAEGAILGVLTALIYTFQMMVGIGTAISYLAVIPLVYGLSKTYSEWARIVIVASVVILMLNDLGGTLFFLLFIVPLSLSVFLRMKGFSLFMAEGPLFWALVLILYKLAWIVGFTIPAEFDDWWVILVFLFCAAVVFVFSKITYMTLKPFDLRIQTITKTNGALLLSSVNLLTLLMVYGFSFQAFLSAIFMLPLLLTEPFETFTIKMEKMLLKTIQLIHNRNVP